jgi:hypothetical protein
MKDVLETDVIQTLVNTTRLLRFCSVCKADVITPTRNQAMKDVLETDVIQTLVNTTRRFCSVCNANVSTPTCKSD